MENFKELISKEFSFDPNHNQLKILERLMSEVMLRENLSLNQLTNCLNHDMAQKKYLGRDKFFALKKLLINRRFPLTKANNALKESDIFFSKLKQPLDNNWQVKKTFIPEAVFVEKEVRKSFV
ncbi:MAG: hypothetical protein PHE97_04650, partial [Candidatus Omnitrophica bacterium]|nr:hypothetical protein [Candidatus Omnitrophota bacterium]